MSKIIDEVRHKVAGGQSLFRRSTIEKMLLEYDRLLLRNTSLEKQAVEQPRAVDDATRRDFERDHLHPYGYNSLCGLCNPHRN